MAGRTIRAPRGTERSCRGWVQEAALRMLMNNLDPEVAERPEDLVVYGGTGKAARDWAVLRPRSWRRSETLGDDETLLVQSGKPVGVLRTHPDAPRVLIANSNLVGPLGHLGAIPRARGEGPDDVRPDDRRVVDLHRHAGDPAGHLRDLRRRRAAPTSAATISRAGWCSPAASGGMGGAQPLAATMNGGGVPRRGGGSRSAPAAGSRPLPGRGRQRPRRRAGARSKRRASPEAGAVHRGHRQRRRRVPGAGPARHQAGSGDRPDLARTIR